MEAKPVFLFCMSYYDPISEKLVSMEVFSNSFFHPFFIRISEKLVSMEAYSAI